MSSNIEPGVYELTSDEYHSIDSHLGSTSIKAWLAEDATPRKWKHGRENPKPPTGSMELGDAMHTSLLEPEFYDSRYVVYDGKRDKRHTAYQAFLKDNAGFTVLTPSQDARARELARYVREEASGVYAILSSGKAEVSGFWRDKETGIDLKWRGDYVGRAADHVVLLDVKTTGDMSLRARQKKLVKPTAGGPIAVQAAMYMDGHLNTHGTMPEAFSILWAATEGPVDVLMDQIPPDALEWGRKKYRKALEGIARCRETNTWPGWKQRVHTLELPEWAKKEEEA